MKSSPLGSPAQLVADQLRDDRSRRVVFVSHCLLNENTRYLGGAFRPAAVSELVDELIDQRVGICQMPCPEQHAWGGVLKRRMLLAYGIRGGTLYRSRALLLSLFVLHTHLVYRRLARETVAEIADYERSGYTIVGIIGVGASPSCGVRTTIDIRRAFDAMAATPRNSLNRHRVNRDIVLACRQAGAGIFIRSLQRQLRRRHLVVPLLEHDLIAEMHGQQQRVLGQLPHTMTR